MRHSCFSKTLLFILLSVISGYAGSFDKSAAVYYGEDISYSNLGLHEYIIVESDNISSYTHGFKTYKKKIYAYVSIGEASSYRKYFKDIKEEWKIAENKRWNSVVMDISDDEYHEFMYEQVIQPLVDKGYANFFFDTLDSYQIAAKNEEERKRYEAGLIRFIKKFKQRFTDSKLIVNRGFEIMDDIHQELDAVLFESLFYGLSSNTLSYTKVEEEDRKWLLTQVEKVQSYGLDVIGVDYMQSQEKEKIDEMLEKFEKLGIIPYISNKKLDRYGSSSKQALKREILILHNTSDNQQFEYLHKLLSFPLEYLGYVPITKHIDEGLPNKDLMSRYKAVIVWSQVVVKNTVDYENWVKSLVDENIKVLFLNSFGVADDSALCSFLNINKVSNKADILDKQTIRHKSKMIGFESDLHLNYTSMLYQPINAQELVVIDNSASQKSVPIAKMSWGGYALSEMLITYYGDDALWITNPFDFFKMTLELDDIPVPDPTTQTGRRLLFAHIDGDASMNRAEWDPHSYSIGITYDKVLKRYTIPQSVSIVEGEISAQGLYPKESAALEEIAKKIYSLEHVEAATHTYSHPFQWGKIMDGNLSEEYRLKLKGYDFSIDKEIRGSLGYINNHLLPQSKKQAKTVFWTGDCLPTKEVLAYTYRYDLLNINGGDTFITNDKPWISRIAPYGLKLGEYYQVFVGAQNENVYTDHFTGTFWGYKKAIQTFELTNKPRRFKPIDIYYHFYSASKTASLRALEEVYAWALSQETMPIYTSEYIPKVLEFYDLSMYKVDNGWRFEGMNELKTLRLDSMDTKVLYSGSQSVLGEKKEGKSTYVHLNTDEEDIRLEFGEKRDENYLIDTNAEVLSYKRTQKEVSFTLKGHVNIVLNYHLKEGCELKTSFTALQTRQKSRDLLLKFDAKETDVLIRCP